MSADELYEIAKIISNDYNGTRPTFTAKKVKNCWHLTTNRCDMAPLIRVHEISNKISTIEVNGDYTEGWESVQPNTYTRVEKYLNSINSLPK